MKKRRKLANVTLAILLATSSALSCTSVSPIWIPRDPGADPLYRYIEGGKAGYIDQTGKVVIPPVLPDQGSGYDEEFHDGLLLNWEEGYYVNTRGEKVVFEGLVPESGFSDGLALAKETRSGKLGFINTKGEFEISPRFDSRLWFSEDGIATVEVEGRIGYINLKGEFLVQPKFLDATGFSEGLARVVVEGPCIHFQQGSCGDSPVALPKGTKIQYRLPACKYTFIDRSGNAIFEQTYDRAGPFREGLAPVRIGKFWGYIDKKGSMVGALRFDSAEPFSDGLALVSKYGLFGYVDRNGVYAIKPQFKYAESFTEGIAAVGDESGYWYIDRNGSGAFPGKFAEASPFFKGVAHVRLLSETPDEYGSYYSSTFAYIDRAGKIVFTYHIDPED